MTRPSTAAAARTDAPDRRVRRLLALVVALAVIAAVVSALARGNFRDAPFEPSSPRPDGSGAVASVLREDGTDVQEARRTDEAAAALREGRTVLVTTPSSLSRAQLELLRDALDEGTGHLVLLAPDFGTLSVLAPGIHPGGTLDQERARLSADPACGDAAFRARTVDARPAGDDEDRRDQVPSIVYRVAEGPGTSSCFSTDHGASIVVQGSVTVLGSPAYLVNADVGRTDNSAVALNALGGPAGLTWYLPSATDPMASDEAGPLAHIPTWLPLTLTWLAVCLVLLLVAVSRRLGPVLIEPLPVTVRAQELVLGRANLLRRSGARDRAARSLRSAAAVRLADRLGVRRQEPLAALVAALTPHTRLTGQELRALLGDTGIRTDEDLVRLAHDLDALEKEIDS